MWIYIARRLLWLPFLLFAASIITFTLGRVAPGDPAQVILGNRATPEAVARLRNSLGLDRPFIVQYADYMWGVFHGNFGESYRFRGRSVGSLLASKVWVSVQVNAAAMIVSLGLGLPLGFWIAHRQGRWEDPFTVAVSVILMSIPVMVTIPFLLWVFCLKAGWLPCSGWGGFLNERMIIPAIAMGIPGVAGWTRLMRASTLDVLGQDFIRTARSKGLSEFTINSIHVLKNALIPIITMLTFALAGMLSTGFITETILGIPGVGRFTVQSIFDRDYPVIMAVTLIGSGVFVIANLLADITYAIVDPRIHYR